MIPAIYQMTILRGLAISLAVLFLLPGNPISAQERQQPVQQRLTAAEQQRAAEALRLYNAAKDLRRQGKYDEAIKSAEGARDIYENVLGPDHSYVRAIISLLGHIYFAQKDYAAAETLYKQVILIQEKTLGPNHTNTVSSIVDLANALVKQRDYEAAEPLYERAVAIREETLGAEHSDTINVLNKQADAYSHQRKYASAEPLYRRVLKVREKTLGPEHPDAVISLNRLAGVLKSQARYEALEPLYQRVLKIQEAVHGPEHPHTADSLNDLAVLYDFQENYAAAEPLFQRALKIWEKVRGPEHQYTGIGLNNLANLYRSQAKYADAEPLYRRVLKIREKTLGPEHPDTVISLNRLGGVLKSQARYEAAEPVYQRVLKIQEKVLGPDHPHTADSLNNLAVLYDFQADYAAAEPLYQRALKIREKILGPDHRDTAISLSNLGNLYASQGNYAAAEPLQERALNILEKILGPEHLHTARCLSNLASLYRSQGTYAAAEPLYQRALKIREKVLGAEHPDTAASLSNLATLYKSQAKYAAAEPLYDRALKIREKILGPDHPDTALSLDHLATLYKSQANYAAAEPLYDRALKIRKKVLGPEHPDTAVSLNNLASLYTSQANYAAAEPLYQRALKIQEKVLGPEHADTADSLDKLASLYDLKANYGAAEPLYQRALKIREKILGPEHHVTAASLNNLAHLYYSQENYAAAEPLYKRSLRICENVLGPEHPGTATGLNNLAKVYDSQAHYTAAEPLFQRALKIFEKDFGPEHPNTAVSLNSLASLHSSQQNYVAAEPPYKRALAIQEKVLGPEHPRTAATLSNLAGLYFSKGEFREAISATDRARKGQRAHVSRVLPALPAREQEVFLRSMYARSYHIALSLALSQAASDDAATISASWLVNGKGVSQEALAQRNLQTRDVDDPTVGPVVKELLSVRTRLAALAMNAPEPDEQAKRRTELERLTARDKQLSAQLGGGNSNATSDWIEISQIQEALPADGVLIDIARFNIFDFAAKGRETKWKAAHYAAWITSSATDAKTVLIDLGEADAIDQLVENVRHRISDHASQAGAIAKDGEDAAVVALMEDTAALADLIWKPLAPHVGDAKQIILSPDGALWLAPWSALPASDAGNEFLLERFNIRMVISGRDLVAQPDDRTPTPPVILANPDFDQTASLKKSAIRGIFKALPPENENATRSFSAQSTLPKVLSLPNTGIEALAIQPHIETYTKQKAGLYKEQYALERVAKVLRSPRIATFATHGFFLPNQETKPDDRNLRLGENTRGVALDTNGQLIENPLLRCGLLFSGCNNREASVADDDGILTGMEIVGIDFRGTELVVLSACETGVGDVKNGEGVAGLRQAFQLAGAQSVVSSLWNVADGETARLMSLFFENLANGMNKSEALRQAQLTRIKARRERYGAAHPFFWAAFTLTGQE